MADHCAFFLEKRVFVCMHVYVHVPVCGCVCVSACARVHVYAGVC